MIVAPDFSPSSYPPALRIRFFARHLPAFGWEPTILTVDPAFYEWDVDPENQALLPDDLEVIRCPALPASVTRRIGLGDLSARSLFHMWKAVKRLASERRFDLLFVSVPPCYSALLGRLGFERLGLPYVIDYIDPWVSDYWQREPGASRFSKRAAAAVAANALEPMCLRRAGHITGVSKGTTDDIVARYPWLTESDATEIPYGGEPSDFEYLKTAARRNPTFDPNDGFIHLSYVGRGGADMVPALRAVFSAVRAGLQRAPDVFGRLRMHFVGTTYAADGDGRYQVLPIAREIGVEELVDEHPARVSYLDALKILVDSHGLVVVGSYAAHYTASKIFPYILAERPLLALFHERSTVVRIVRETGGGDVLTFSDDAGPMEHVASLSHRLERIIADPAGRTPHYARDAFDRYTTRAMTKKLATVFDGVVDGRTRRDGSQPGGRPLTVACDRAAEVGS